jgi:hypothetical protein
MKVSKTICLTALIGAASLAFAADTPFAGTWKLNLDKSKLTGDTVKFSSTGGLMRITGNGDSYEFKQDGSDTKTRFGNASWKKIDDNTLEEIDKVKGNVEAKTTWTLSSDSKTLHCAHYGRQAGRRKLRRHGHLCAHGRDQGLRGNLEGQRVQGKCAEFSHVERRREWLNLR